MGLFAKISELWRPTPKTAEELAAHLEAVRMKAEVRAMRQGGPRVKSGGRDASL
jgi:hypothetical protein